MRQLIHTFSAIAQASLILALVACTKMPESEVIPAGPLMSDSIGFQFAVYYLPKPAKDPLTVLHEVLAARHSKLKLVAQLPKAAQEPLLSAHMLDRVQEEYAPPDMKSLGYFGRGLTREQAQALQKSAQAYILDFGHPGAEVWPGLRTACEIAEAVARETGGLLWDEQTREVFSPDEWHKRRIASWKEVVPEISRHTVIHAYNTGEYVRAITLGMSKFGLPDVVVDEFSWSSNESMGLLINLFSQAMGEGAAVAKGGEFDLDLRALKNKKVRDTQLESLKHNATATALLSLRKGKWEEGDPNNRLIEIAFNRYPGRDVHASQEQLLSSLFGWEDAVTNVKHNEELLAASGRAKAQLPLLQQAFAAGLQPGEYIQVKAPFAVPAGGQEWMWVEITAWNGNDIKGLLKNEPFNIPSLHGGQIVEIRQQDVFDFIRRYADGREEGNETGAIIRKMQDKNGEQSTRKSITAAR
jgi:uncharacterized protein YegJ (DUF2314 family)